MIDLKENKILKYDSALIEEMPFVSIAPKFITFHQEPNPFKDPELHVLLLTAIERETLSLNTKYFSKYRDSTVFGEGSGICEKIPYPSMVSSKNKV